MTINKVPTFQEAEESSSLTSSLVSPLLFIRRPDLTYEIRLYLGICGLGSSFRDCTIKELGARYKVSYTFIYEQANILRRSMPLLFGPKAKKETDQLAEVLKAIGFCIEGKLETRSALEGLSNFASSLGVSYTSTNFIAQALAVAGSLVGCSYESEEVLQLVFLCDEVYAAGKAILVTLEAQSMMVLDIKLVENSLVGTDWEARYKLLKANNVRAKILIKDGGTQMASAAHVLGEQVLIGADTFHAIPYRLGVFHCTFSRAVAKAEAKQADRAIRFANTKSYKTAVKIEKEWEAAKLDTLQAQDRLEWFDYYYFRMLQQLRPFTSQGIPRDKIAAQQVIQESLEALALLGVDKLQKHLNHIEKLLENGELFHFLDQVPTLHQQLQSVLSPETSWLWMLYWQWDKKAQQTHSSKVSQNAKQQASAAQHLLEEHYQVRLEQMKDQQELLNQFEALKTLVFGTLNQIVQASSLVETFNSILKPFINSARGQISQQMLNLVMFKHNYSPFRRGKRKGKAPIELFTNQSLDKKWIDLIMEKVQAAFIEHHTCSLKQLHQIICPKSQGKENKQQNVGLVKQLHTEDSCSKNCRDAA